MTTAAPNSFHASSLVRRPSLPTTELALEAGSLVGKYRLISPLARGGMAQLWAAEPARDTGVVRTVAIKVIRPDIASDERYAAMFIDEANVAMAVHHPNVCRTHELGHEDDLLFMCMEWVAGDSLAGLLRRGRSIARVEAGLAARIIAEALAGLHAAHEIKDQEGHLLGVIHRDVSPPNILLSLTGQVKVSDFGIAKARHQLHERTKTGEVKGKFGYLAPEQITGSASDRRVDIYAMGCVLYVASLGLRPFGHGPDAMPKILRGELKKPTDVDPDFPKGLEDIIVKAIQLDPAARFQSADEMRRALEEWLVSEKRVVTQSHIASCLRERISPVQMQAIQQLQKRLSASDVIDSGPTEDFAQAEPATASTSLVNSVRGKFLLQNHASNEAQEEDQTVQTSFTPQPTGTTLTEARSRPVTDTGEIRAELRRLTLSPPSSRPSPFETKAIRWFSFALLATTAGLLLWRLLQ